MKTAITGIRIIKETEDLREAAVKRNGKKKIMKPGHIMIGLDEVVKPFLDAKVAEKLTKGQVEQVIKDKKGDK